MTKKTLFARFLEEETAATAIEYGLIAALIAVGIIVGATAMGTSLNDLFGGVDGEIAEAFGT